MAAPNLTDIAPDRLTDLLARLLGPTVRTLSIPEWLRANPVALASLSEAQVAAELKLSPVRARTIASALALHRLLAHAGVPERASLRVPELVAEVMAPYANRDCEHLWCLPLDPRSRLIGEPVEVTRGDVDGTDAGPRAFFRAALRSGATSALATHNHPSGSIDPSAADIEVTRRLVAAGRAVDCQLVDHVIIAPGGAFTSLRRERPELFR